MRRTKICATIGPACRAPAQLRALLEAGVDIVRLNFSHGHEEQHAAVARAVRREERRIGRAIAICQDLQGPRIRVGRIASAGVDLEPGQSVFLRTAPGNKTREPAERKCSAVLPVTYRELHRDAGKGSRILLRDGAMELAVQRVGSNGLVCEVVRGGLVLSHSGLNAPGVSLGVGGLTARDRQHLRVGLEMGVDAIALSFVRDAADLHAARRALLKHCDRDQLPLLVAKIERSEAVHALDEILDAADGVLVARGDLGVECPLEEVPLLQKDMIQRCMRSSKFVITATQMLESMTRNARPTRAEVSDVANAVLDGSDAVMLSAESAIGDHPVLVVETMDRIARHVEQTARMAPRGTMVPDLRPDDFLDAIVGSAVRLAQLSHAKAIVAITASGRTAAVLSSRRPGLPIIAFARSEVVRRRLDFYRAVDPMRLGSARSLDRVFASTVEEMLATHRISRGDNVVFVGGAGVAKGSAHTLKVKRV